MAALILLLLGVARAGTVDDLRMAELERARARVANQVHLAAFDLVDEMVWGWREEPVFGTSTPVVLASVTVPVGLGTGLEALLENHLASVIGSNPATNVQLVHCPTCTQVTVHSGPTATVVARGIDNPGVWEELGLESGRHALFVDVEAEGTWLVLRARLTQLTPDLPIVWSRTLSTSADTPALLRAGDDLKSVEEAREEYLAAISEQPPLGVPIRFAIRGYAVADAEVPVPPPPFLWLQSGIEVGSRARDWTGTIVAGATFLPQAYQGIMMEARINRLLTGRIRSKVRPDLYGFVGAAAISVWGPGTASFSKQRVNADQVLQFKDTRDPRTSFGTINVGLDLRMGHLGMSTFLEALPALSDSPNLGTFVHIGPFYFSTAGMEVAFWL